MGMNKEILFAGSMLAFSGFLWHCGDNGNTGMQTPDLTTMPVDLAAPSDLSTLPPIITSVLPQTGINNAPTMISITGLNYQSGATVIVGGQPCANAVVSATQITCTAPARAATCGPQDVVVTNPDGKSVSRPNGFTYYGTMVAFGPATPPTLAANTNPSAVETADLNRDGKVDLVVSLSGSSSVGIYLGNGDGTFRAPTTLTTAGVSGTARIALADMNGDMKADLVVGNNFSNNFTYYQGNGDGTFRAGTNIATPFGGPATVATGDFNGDMKLDVVVSSYNVASLGVYLGNGDGTFGAVSVLGASANPNGMDVGDFNGDGKLDIATANNNSANTSILLGNGDGTFRAAVMGGATGLTPRVLQSTDIDGDMKLDLLVSNQGGNTLSLLLGNGDGSFRAQTTLTTPGGPLGVRHLDLNLDGKKDFVNVANTSNFWSIFLGQGNGTFGAAISTSFGMSPSGLAVADFNNDKLPDVAVTSYNGNLVGIFLQECR